MPKTEKTTGVAAEADAATPYAFINYKLHACRFCGEIHDYITRGCVTLVAYGGSRGYEAGASVGEPEKLEALPARWRPFKSPRSDFHDSSTDDEPAPIVEVFDPVYGSNGLPL